MKLLPSVDMPLAVILPNGNVTSPDIFTLPVTDKSCNMLTSLLNIPFNATTLPNVVKLPVSVRLSTVILPVTDTSPAAVKVFPLILPGVTMLPNKLMLLPTLALPPILASN